MIKGFNINGNIEKIDYESLENKPFYSEIVTDVNRDIIPSQEVEFVDFGVDGFSLAQILLDSIDVVEGGQYNLKIDEQECPIVIAAHTDIGLPGFELFCGNLSLLNSFLGVNLADTGENYCGFFGISEGSPCLGIIYQTTTPIHTIELSYAGDVAPIITEGTYTFNEQGQDGISICNWNSVVNANFIFQEGDMFNLIFDGQTYENITCRTIEGDCYLGSTGVLGVPDGPEENYFITTYNDHNESTISILTSLPVGDYKVSLERVLPSTTTEIVHKIDSKYLDMDIPYTEDGEGNIVFENDVYINGSTSVSDIEENLIKTKTDVFNLQTETNTIKTNVSTLQGDVGVAKSDISALKTNSRSKQLVEGLFGGFSTHNKAKPIGVNSWIEGEANCFDDITSSCANQEMSMPYLSVVITTNNKGTTTTTKIVLTPQDAQNITVVKTKLEEYPYLSIVFTDKPNKKYYIKMSSLNPTSNTIEIYFTFVDGYDTFPIDANMTRNIQTLCGLPKTGDYSHAEGFNVIATGRGSHAEGINTTASIEASHAEGYSTVASGLASHAEGGSTKATGEYSHAEGAGTKATGNRSHAEGGSTDASGNWSHAEGNVTDAIGDYSHAEGSYAEAKGEASHAEGTHTTASGAHSHAEGYNTTAIGDYSHAEGLNTTASGVGSHAEGGGTIASGDYSHVQGRNNIEDTEGKYAHIVGNGGNRSNRSNAHTLDWDGNAWYAGTIEGTGIVLPSTTEGSTKKFLITVNDSGTLTATEIIEEATTE